MQTNQNVNPPKPQNLISYTLSDIENSKTELVHVQYSEIPLLAPQNQFPTQINNNFSILRCNSFFPPSVTYEYIFSEYKTDIGRMTADQIRKRMVVVKNFLFYKRQTLEAVLQYDGFFIEQQDCIRIGNVIFYTRESYCQLFGCVVCSGFWHELVMQYVNANTYCFGFDIISLHSFLMSEVNLQYSQSVEELYDYFSSRNFIQRSDTLSSKEFYIQEKNPISLSNPVYFDKFFEKFNVENIVKIHNSHNRIIGTVWCIRTIYGDSLEIYFTFWRHRDTSMFSLYPLPPAPPYDVYFPGKDYYQKSETKQFVLCNTIGEFCDKLNGISINKNSLVPAIIVNGLKNIVQSDVSVFSGSDLYLNLNDELDYTTLKLINSKFKECKIASCNIFFRDGLVTIDEIIKEPEKFNFQRPSIESLIALPGKIMHGQGRSRTIILDPIIESGTITWLFAPEKAGKTLLALTIAQAVGMGDSAIGEWRSREPKKVLYIDGEMPGDKLNQHIEKIARGLGGGFENPQRAFSVYLFGEDGLEYENILDDAWQTQHLDEILTYDLIIIDNYYTLYENLNPIRFIRWMKQLTKKNISFLVLDHTNAEGKLQGSMVKRRAMDLGLKLELLSKNEINITCHYDRYGKEHEYKAFSLIPCFATSEFSYLGVKFMTSEKDSIEFSRDVVELAAILHLKEQGLNSKKISEDIGRSEGHISKSLKKIGYDANLVPRYESDKTKELLKKVADARKMCLERFENIQLFIEFVKNLT